MSLILNAEEMAALAELAEQKDLSKIQTIRQALRLYTQVHHRQLAGDRIYFENDLGKCEVVLL